MKQYWAHFRYLMVHKWYVFWECCKRGIIWRGLMHDMSKFRPSEFFPYAEYFFLPDGTRRDFETQAPLSRENEAFDRAWCYHTRRNDHHWEFWHVGTHGSAFYRKQIAVIPSIWALKEMICDMIGASAAQGHPNPVEGARNFYLTHADRIILHPVARIVLENAFGISRCEKNGNTNI